MLTIMTSSLFYKATNLIIKKDEDRSEVKMTGLGKDHEQGDGTK